MKYILDSSMALKWVLPEADSAKMANLGGLVVLDLRGGAG